MAKLRQYKEHTGIEVLPFVLDDQILQAPPGQKKTKDDKNNLTRNFQNL